MTKSFFQSIGLTSFMNMILFLYKNKPLIEGKRLRIVAATAAAAALEEPLFWLILLLLLQLEATTAAAAAAIAAFIGRRSAWTANIL